MRQNICKVGKKLYLCTAFSEMPRYRVLCGNSSVGRARPCQGRGREFESRLPLFVLNKAKKKPVGFYLPRWRNW